DGAIALRLVGLAGRRQVGDDLQVGATVQGVEAAGAAGAGADLELALRDGRELLVDVAGDEELDVETDLLEVASLLSDVVGRPGGQRQRPDLELDHRRGRQLGLARRGGRITPGRGRRGGRGGRLGGRRSRRRGGRGGRGRRRRGRGPRRARRGQQAEG